MRSLRLVVWVVMVLVCTHVTASGVHYSERERKPYWLDAFHPTSNEKRVHADLICRLVRSRYQSAVNLTLRVLDLGCGDGFLSGMIAECLWNRTESPPLDLIGLEWHGWDNNAQRLYVFQRRFDLLAMRFPETHVLIGVGDYFVPSHDNFVRLLRLPWPTDVVIAANAMYSTYAPSPTKIYAFFQFMLHPRAPTHSSLWIMIHERDGDLDWLRRIAGSETRTTKTVPLLRRGFRAAGRVLHEYTHRTRACMDGLDQLDWRKPYRPDDMRRNWLEFAFQTPLENLTECQFTMRETRMLADAKLRCANGTHPLSEANFASYVRKRIEKGLSLIDLYETSALFRPCDDDIRCAESEFVLQYSALGPMSVDLF